MRDNYSGYVSHGEEAFAKDRQRRCVDRAIGAAVRGGRAELSRQEKEWLFTATRKVGVETGREAVGGRRVGSGW